ncbi:hypothetical protein KUCAC02_017757 [Chaenocephalus aceratus]|uniref:Uncharacterized protein n=1 Tax=Chaenocephalus aceratus TaxID=36190 RepID=A0ACB9W3K7_CHAAC|nr:hypothetical protein KUCAC02_017757 [Chaenocephalus aceratus]
MMDNQGGDRESAAGSSVSARGEEPSSGELPPELTCPPEDYRTAKFSLAAYLLCWALLRWYQKLRCQSAPPQVGTSFCLSFLCLPIHLTQHRH